MSKIWDIKFVFAFFIFFFFLVFTLQAYTALDPDFGWHVRLGELTIKNGGVFKTDPFSYTMPSFPFVDHEWLTNIFLYNIYNKFGKLASSLLYVALAFAAIWMSFFRLKIGSNKKLDAYLLTFLCIPSAALLLGFFGIRPQVESWLMYSIFLRFFLDRKFFEKNYYLSAVFLVVWVNIHGSFPLPIVTMFIVSIVRSFRERKIWFYGFVSILFSILATGINPYGFRVWHEVYQQVTDSSVRWVLVEWKPFFYSFNIYYLFFVVLYIFSIKQYFKQYNIELVFLNIFFFFQGVMSVRHIPLWLLINLPMQYGVLDNFYLDLAKIKFGRSRFLKAIKVGILLSFGFYLVGVTSSIFSSRKGITEDDFYPKMAILFLREKPSSGNVFSDYGWGGYLVWKYPEKKVFADGRMATWKWNGDLPNESNYIMGDYVSFINGELDMDENFEKYNIDTVLWPNNPIVNPSYALEVYFRNLIGLDVREVFDPNKYMLQKGWSLIYKDDVSSIYRKP